MEEIYFDEKDTPEQRERQRQIEEQEAELARKIRREVLRVQSGEAQEDIAQDEEEAREEEAQRRLEARAKRRRNASAVWQLLTGNILVNKGVSRYYPHMIIVAGMFFVSIMVMFYSLHMDMRYLRLEREVRLLRESSLRYQSLRYQQSSHSAIMKQLSKRGIVLEETTAPSTLID